MQPLAFVDCETTGLNADIHEVWEVALLVRFHDLSPTPEGKVIEERKQWFLPVESLAFADPFALKLSGFHDRHPHGLHNVDLKDGRIGKIDEDKVTELLVFSRQFAKLTRGASLLGCVPSFDEERIRKILRSNGLLPEYHYQPIDVETFAAGWLEAQGIEFPLPWDSDALSEVLKINTDDFERHTAMGDVDWAAAMWDAVHAQS